MRIGKFAEKHGVTQDTIRYYLDRGLLVTEKKGGQYKFNEADSQDFDRIMELKALEFSLTEIQNILTFQRLSGANTDVFRSLYLSFLEEKKKQISNELLKYNKLNSFLKDKIHDIKAEDLKESQKLGFPITALSILVCPLCQGSLSVSDGAIERNMVMDANIQCECGYIATIKEGVYIDDTAVRTKMINGKPMPTKEEYLASSSHNYINFLYKGMATLTEYINKYQKNIKYIMELDNCVGFFLLQYIQYLPSNSIYILIDYDKNRIIQLKKNLEMYYEHKNFMFLCCDFHRLPIRKSSIDTIVDFWMTKTYAQNTGKFLLEKLKGLLKENGSFFAAHPYLGLDSKGDLKQKSDNRGYFSRETILEKLALCNLSTIDVTDIGPVIEDNQHNIDMKKKELCQVVYAGRKNATIE